MSTGFDYVHTVTGEVVRSEDFDPLERDEVKYQRRARRSSGGSALGDRIVRDGPYTDARDFMIPTDGGADQWNGLRDELIELRARAAHVAAMAHNAEVTHSDGVPPEALRWQPGEWRGCAPVTFNTDDVPDLPGPSVTRVDPARCPRCTSPDVSTRFVVTGGSTDASYCGDRWHDRAPARWVPGDTITPPQWLCPVCYRPMAPGMVECAGCAGAEDAAAKRQADQ